MDHEQAETYLRQLAEAELRSGTRSTRFFEAVRALTAVGAVDAGLADAIGYDLELTRRARQQAPRPGAPRFSPPMLTRMRPMIRRPARTVKASPGTSLLAPVGLRVPVPPGDVRAEIFLLAYLRNTSGARIAIHASGTDDGDPGMWEQTFLHVHTTALGPDASLMPRLSLLDNGGRWHLTDADGWRWASGDPTSYLTLTPPLGRPARVEIIASGRSAEVRVEVPLEWR